MADADVAGMSIAPGLVEPRTRRLTVAIVMSRWGSDWGERRMAVRLVAGALALGADIVVISLDDRSNPAKSPLRKTFDGIFPIYSAQAPISAPRVRELLRATLAIGDLHSSPEAARLPDVASRQLLGLEAEPSAEALGMLDDLSPDVVVLAGVETLWMAEALPVGTKRPRVVVMPLLGIDDRLASSALEPLAEIADAIGVFSDGEHRLLAESAGGRRPELVHRLRLAFPVNTQAAKSGLAGMASFGQYILVLSGWPADDRASGLAPPHDYIRGVLGKISVAEVRHGRWLVSGEGRHFDVPWAPSRMNLWRLMANAVTTLDVRPPGAIGREAVESMMFGTPVVVPAGTVAAEHAAHSNGGLWYRARGEMLDCLGRLLENEAERDRLGQAGQRWAEREHGDTEGFVEDVTRMVLG